MGVEHRGELGPKYVFHGGDVRIDAAVDGGPARAYSQTNRDTGANDRAVTAAADCRAVGRETFGDQGGLPGVLWRPGGVERLVEGLPGPDLRARM